MPVEKSANGDKSMLARGRAILVLDAVKQPDNLTALDVRYGAGSEARSDEAPEQPLALMKRAECLTLARQVVLGNRL